MRLHRKAAAAALAGLLGILLSPLPVHADEVDEGRSLYNELCVNCHGRDMQNPGLAFDLRKFPKDDKSRFFNSVQNGTPKGMPPWKAQLSAEDIETLWSYVKSGG
jgi:mono/diheme cytochrome c family protein